MGHPDYQHIAELEREIYGHTWFNPNDPIPRGDDYQQAITMIGLQLNINSRDQTLPPWADQEYSGNQNDNQGG